MATEIKSLTRMSKQELRDALLAAGYTEEQLIDDDGKQMKRPALAEKLKDHQQGENSLNNLLDMKDNNSNDDDDDIGEIVISDATEIPNNSNTEYADKKSEELIPPTPNDPEWTQYVLGKFLEDEVDGQNPRVEGLRRVAGELVGELIEEGCDLVASPTTDNNFRACAKAWGIFLTPDGREKRFEALADAHSENCFEDFATYLVAMADTRAKGRMFRNALCLRRVVAAEEISKTVAMSADIQKGGTIHTSQISLIRLMADRHNFTISKILDDLGIQYELNENTGDVNLQSLAYEDAMVVAKEMRKMREQKVGD